MYVQPLTRTIMILEIIKSKDMGCRNACICGGRCSESCYEAEKYCGEAEDIYDELHGKSKEEEEYYKAMEEEYYKAMEEQEE